MLYTDIGLLVKLRFSETGISFDSLAVKIERGEEVVTAGEAPGIFAEINAEEYEKLIPLSAKLYIKSEIYRRSKVYPDKFGIYCAGEWKKFFETFAYFKGVEMDFPIILKEALKEKEKAWKTSRLTAVLEHMFTQFDRYTLPEKEEMFLSVFEDGNK